MGVKAKPSELERLIEEGVQIALEAVAESAQGALRFKLSAPAFKAAAVRQAETDERRLDMLRERLTGARWEPVRRCLGIMVEWLKRPEYGHPLNDRQILRAFEQVPGANMVMAQAGYTAPELAALAGLLATEQAPEAFGPVANPEEHEAELKARERRMNQIQDRIGELASLEDCEEAREEVSDWQRQHGFGRFRLKSWPGVYFFPRETLGRRLIEHVAQERRRRPVTTPRWALPLVREAEADEAARRKAEAEVWAYGG